MNELVVKDFSVDFKPAEISINNIDELKNQIEQLANEFDNMVYSSVDDMREDRTKLNKLAKGLDDKRKEIKREFNKPLNDFEGEVKDMIALINVPLSKMNESIRDKEQKEREKREDWLEKYLNKQSEKTGVDVDLINIDRSWTNKGQWTENGNPRKTLKEQVTSEINRVKEEHKLHLAHKKIIETACEKHNLEPDGWVSQLDYKSVEEILDDITATVERKTSAEPREPSNFEEEDVPRGNTSETNLNAKNDLNLIEKEDEKESERITETIQVTGTINQLQELNKYMQEIGIEVKPVVYAEDDLPF